ncbi:hypothetical protein pdam_00018093, partial [Pocillopora damicornis]
MFQYKIIHRILPTNSLLHKIKKVTSPSCPFCPSECQNLWHFNTKLLLSELKVMFGIIRCHTYCLVLNHLIILVTCNKEREFRNKWKFFLSLIVLCPIQ